MGRFIDFDRSEREIPYGAMSEFPDQTLADRQHYRRGPEVVDECAIEDAIQAVLAQVQDQQVPGSCVASKLRPDRLYLELALRRLVQRQPPRRLAVDFGRPVSYVMFAVRRGRRIIERMGFDQIRETLAQSHQSG